MKVYLIYNKTNNKYYQKKNRWSTEPTCESYFTEQAAKWHRTYLLNRIYWKHDDAKGLIRHPLHQNQDVVIEEYQIVKVEDWLNLQNGQIGTI